jgi:hypothetical protein
LRSAPERVNVSEILQSMPDAWGQHDQTRSHCIGANHGKRVNVCFHVSTAIEARLSDVMEISVTGRLMRPHVNQVPATDGVALICDLGSAAGNLH